jgi:hypothetical protein
MPLSGTLRVSKREEKEKQALGDVAAHIATNILGTFSARPGYIYVLSNSRVAKVDFIPGKGGGYRGGSGEGYATGVLNFVDQARKDPKCLLFATIGRRLERLVAQNTDMVQIKRQESKVTPADRGLSLQLLRLAKR